MLLWIQHSTETQSILLHSSARVSTIILTCTSRLKWLTYCSVFNIRGMFCWKQDVKYVYQLSFVLVRRDLGAPSVKICRGRYLTSHRLAPGFFFVGIRMLHMYQVSHVWGLHVWIHLGDLYNLNKWHSIEIHWAVMLFAKKYVIFTINHDPDDLLTMFGVNLSIDSHYNVKRADLTRSWLHIVIYIYSGYDQKKSPVEQFKYEDNLL